MERSNSSCVALSLLCVFICLIVSCGGSGGPPPTITPRIIETIPHDSSAFTQGFFYDDGRLYESDGLYGNSALRMLNTLNGAELMRVPLDSRFFAEGCAKIGKRLFQITWREQTAFTYSLADLTPGSSIIYSGQGWGLTSDGQLLYMSDGSDTITVRNEKFTIIRKIPVSSQGLPVKNLNELEYADGKICANVWYSDSILEINPKTGKVERIIDCSDLIKQEQPASSECVLNGIAYNPDTGTFYLTGKKWKKIFVVEIPFTTK